MTAHFNHTIVASTDPAQMALFYRDLLEARTKPPPGARSSTSRSVTAYYSNSRPHRLSSGRSTTPIYSMTPTSTGCTPSS
jgi:hypothetical protein